MKPLMLIIVTVFAQCFIGVEITAQIPVNKNIMQIYVNDLSSKLLEHSDKLGMDSSDKLNAIEILYFQEILKKTNISFDFSNKKICYIGPGGLLSSNKQKYFDSLKKSENKIQNTLYFLNSTEKEKCSNYDVVIVYWNKKNYSINEILEFFEKKEYRR